ncbi:MAG: hypothetical protein QOE35_3242 [Actinomycetota bacterium]
MSSPDVTVDERIEADPNTLYDMVSDITKMGQWSPETTACRWVGGASGPAVGARFKGANRDRWRRWSTTCTIVAAERGRRFAFDVAFARVPISHWQYEFAADGGQATVVTESWIDRRPRWMQRISPYVMGVRDRDAHNRDGIRATLAALRAAAQG